MSDISGSGTTSNTLSTVPGDSNINAKGITDIKIVCQSVGTTWPMNWEYDYTCVYSYLSAFHRIQSDREHSACMSKSPGKPRSLSRPLTAA